MERYVMFDFTQMGYPHWVPVSQTEMEILWWGAQGIMQDHDTLAVSLMLEQTRDDLAQQAQSLGFVTPDWISTAVMVMAMEGCLGRPLLPYTWDPV
jgi:hypothetical protein